MRQLLLLLCICQSFLGMGQFKRSSFKDFFYNQREKFEFTECMDGWIRIYKGSKKIYWELDKNIFNRDLSLIITILESGKQAEMHKDVKFGYRGDRFGGLIIFFDQYQENIGLYQYGGQVLTSDSMSICDQLIDEQERARLMYSFPIINSSEQAVLIDVTSLILKNSLFSLSPYAFLLDIGRECLDLAQLKEIVPCEHGVIIRIDRTFESNLMSQNSSINNENHRSTWRIGVGLKIQPKEKMQIRYADNRIGYFTTPLLDSRSDSLKIIKNNVIKRWRLIPKFRKDKAYSGGKVVHPEKKIRFYLDTNIPSQWIPYIKKGIENWNPTYRVAGFKDPLEVIVGKTGDLNKIDDPNYSTVTYKYGAMENAYGRVYIDTRTGEILNCHIGIFHSLFNLLHKWYFVQLNDTLINHQYRTNRSHILGKFLESVVTHEVGHALGLTHNYMGSALYDVDELEKLTNHTSSIMDYVRLNYLRKEPKAINIRNFDHFIPKIGSYDTLAIYYGYRYFFERPLRHQAEYLDSILGCCQSKQRYRFAGISTSNPLSQSEDLSSNPAQATRKNLISLQARMLDNKYWTQFDLNQTILNDQYLGLKDQFKQNIDNLLVYFGNEHKFYSDSILLKDNQIYNEAFKILKEFVFSLPLFQDISLEQKEDYNKFILNLGYDVINEIVRNVKRYHNIQQAHEHLVLFSNLLFTSLGNDENKHIYELWRWHYYSVIQKSVKDSKDLIVQMVLFNEITRIQKDYLSQLENDTIYSIIKNILKN